MGVHSKVNLNVLYLCRGWERCVCVCVLSNDNLTFIGIKVV